MDEKAGPVGWFHTPSVLQVSSCNPCSAFLAYLCMWIAALGMVLGLTASDLLTHISKVVC